MSDWIDFTGKIVLVTGSSRGIGAGMAEAFNRFGARCVVNYVVDPQGRNVADAQGVAARLKDPLVIECDVSNPAAVAAMFVRVQRELGGLDILVNNAGIIRDRSIKKISSGDWTAVLNVNIN